MLLYSWLCLTPPTLSPPLPRVIEMPYAYQCCVYGSCDGYKSATQWEAEQSNADDDPHKRTIALYPGHADTHCESANAHSTHTHRGGVPQTQSA